MMKDVYNYFQLFSVLKKLATSPNLTILEKSLEEIQVPSMVLWGKLDRVSISMLFINNYK